MFGIILRSLIFIVLKSYQKLSVICCKQYQEEYLSFQTKYQQKDNTLKKEKKRNCKLKYCLLASPEDNFNISQSLWNIGGP